MVEWQLVIGLINSVYLHRRKCFRGDIMNCKDFLKIKKKKSDEYLTIDAFIKKYPNIFVEELSDCYISYREKKI